MVVQIFIIILLHTKKIYVFFPKDRTYCSSVERRKPGKPSDKKFLANVEISFYPIIDTSKSIKVRLKKYVENLNSFFFFTFFEKIEAPQCKPELHFRTFRSRLRLNSFHLFNWMHL